MTSSFTTACTPRQHVLRTRHGMAGLTPGGVVVVDDIDHSLGFSRFTERTAPADWLAARHVTGAASGGPPSRQGRGTGRGQAPKTLGRRARDLSHTVVWAHRKRASPGRGREGSCFREANPPFV